MISAAVVDRVLDGIDEAELVELALELGNIDSPPGDERAASDRVHAWLLESGIEARQVGMFPERPNVVGRLPGDGTRPSVVFNAHLDTAWGPQERRWMHRPDDPVYTSAWREGDRLWGNGIVNDKGPLACALIALRAVAEASVPLGGDVTVAGVCGEIGQEPVDEFTSPGFLSKEVGTRYLVEHGGIADFAVVAENTDFGVTTVEAGKAFFKITVLGDRSAYTPYVRHTDDPAEHANAVVRAVPVIEWLTRWGRAYEEAHAYEFAFGTCVPKVSIGAVRAGQPFMPIVSPERCYLYVDVRLTPAQTAMDVERELRSGLGELGIPHLVECTLYRRGYEAIGAEPLLGTLEACHRAEFDRALGGVRPGQASSWRDTNPYNEMGIPAVSYGPSAGRGGSQTWTQISDLVHAARMYARVMVTMSGLPEPSLETTPADS